MNKNPQTQIPTNFQKKICWAALTSLAVFVLASLLGVMIYFISQAVSFLQPILLPLAIAIVLAYFLEPIVAFVCKKGLSRTFSTLLVFLAFFLVASGILLSILPAAWRQGSQFLQNLPSYSQKFLNLGINTLEGFRKFHKQLQTNRQFQSGASNQGGDNQTVFSPEDSNSDFVTAYLATSLENIIIWIQNSIPDFVLFLGRMVQRSIGGFLGAFGLIVGLILVPIFLFYLLRDAPSIQQKWQDFLPIRSPEIKQEVASLLLEINRYIIAFFRGQILVAFIDAILITICLLIMGLEFSVLIGLLAATLGIIPYAGTILSWGPAVLIAAAQYGDWFHPLVVTLIFFGVNQLDSLFIYPRVVGESVGLHPLTVMIAVLFWTIVIGGLLGALLAVPLTAALKVIARRYIWETKFLY
ncbi:MAG: AI-2E family transporter [Chthoniobacterales bacterium]|nr:AI-2E family transporter [Chthoniobacterales bacterium]